MTIEIKQGNYYKGLWRAGVPNGDLLAMLYKDTIGDGCWHLVYRFRYYQDRNAFESKDAKSWHHMKSKTGNDEKAEEMRVMFGKALEDAAFVGGHAIRDLVYIPCEGDGQAMLKILTNPERPGIYALEMSREQFYEYERTGKIPDGVKIPDGAQGEAS